MQTQKNEMIKLIGSKANKPINKNLSHLILAILCENNKSIGIFKELNVASLREQIFKSNENVGFIYLGDKKLKDEQDLFIRIELYKLKNKNLVSFKKLKHNYYTVQSNIKGLEYCKTLLLNLMVDEGIDTEDDQIIEDEGFINA
tara:strand:- start:607 stop:1038 length:432 start_codon:yes stop_codon:yes gene_type:complete